MDQEFQVLVLGYAGKDGTFSGKPIEEFANSFICPVVLVGPDGPEQFHFIRAADLISEKLGVPEGRWETIQVESVDRQPLPRRR